MQRSLLDAQDNLISNGPNLVPGIVRDAKASDHGLPLRGYKCVFIGNPNPTQPDNPLHIVSEPENGFGAEQEDGKTKVWNCKKLADHPVKCRCINLDGLDSPNTPYPIDKPRYPHLAGPHKIALYTEGSESYWSQGRGVFKFGLAAFKVVTREVCEQFHALDRIEWAGKPTTKIGMCDAAYGSVGGDRCPLGWMEFGECVDGKTRLFLHPHWLVPVILRKDMIPEDQIAAFCREKMESVGVPPENFFFDGRGSLAMSFARLWSPRVNAIEFGGTPTERIVGDIMATDDNGVQRPKTAREHYSKFVSELWWSWRYVIESDQMRGLTYPIIDDASPREWRKVKGDRIEVETKADMKKRTGVSPDLADMVVTGVEGARRRGFVISKLGKTVKMGDSDDWMQDAQNEFDAIIKSHLLVHA